MSTPQERSSAARIAAHSRWAYRVPDRSLATAAARAKSPSSITYWLDRVDPDQQMHPGERAKAAENAMSAHFAQLSRRGRRSRERNRGTTDPA